MLGAPALSDRALADRALSDRALSDRAWRLPREARLFFVAAPPVLALLFDPHCATTVDNVARAWLTLTSFTLLTGLAVHQLFVWTAARTVERSAPARLLAHAAGTALLVTVLTFALHPLVHLVYPEVGDDVGGMIWRGVIVSYGYLALARFVGHLQDQAVRERMRAEEERTRAEAERRAALEARLSALTAQLQPHFLFNSLNVCAGLVHTAPDVAEATLDRLSTFLRYALESSEERLVPLERELDAVGAYLAVQAERFGDRLRHEVVGAPGTGVLVPPLVLQPLVENALVHGLDPEHGGLVRVACRRERDRLSITVENEGVARTIPSRAGTGTGLRNVRERLRLVFGEDATLEHGAREGGYRAIVTVPLGRTT